MSRALLCAVLVVGCRDERPTIEVEPLWVSAPGDLDVGACADVHAARACWSEGKVVRVPRVVPGTDAPWRCAGEGAARVCRRAAGAPFTCNDSECIQQWPRVPDDGEWECFERAGAVVCRGGEPPAGAAPGPPDPGWICGEGRPRICIDIAPERPEKSAFATCAYHEAGGRLSQRCTKREEPRLGAVCGTCPRGAVCAEGVCLPAKRPEASCWFDADCGAGRACAFATCVSQ